MVRHLSSAPARASRAVRPQGQRPSCNILGPTALGFRHRDDVREIRGLLGDLGIDVRVVAPLDATAADLARLHEADFNVVLYPEVANSAAQWLSKNFGQPSTKTIPIGFNATRAFIEEVCTLAQIHCDIEELTKRSRARWYALSVDSTYLTNKRVFIFGDATHAIAAAKVASQEMGFQVVGLGTYSRELAREVREAATQYGVEALITDDYLEVEQRITELQPELILGSQMERHIAKRLKIPCAVISAPIHVQDFPARYSPQMGFEGANVLFDTWVHPLMMGLEEHLIGMFREDFEFHDGAAPSHLGHGHQRTSANEASVAAEPTPIAEIAVANGAPVTESVWEPEAQKELNKIPFFVRGKAKRNTERFAIERGLPTISLETLYDAKAHFGR
ncbi:MAG: ferredoxin:protochlorophyllide reductase (ATP-dependent) subunit B, partial [Burkholderiaceae bacterium]|nr:ferredoxin:protochlorophyllide reductase (ATP-dependent) subunit B [Burkholderiaceae bacterium]